jgi:hypothetical protein
VLIKQHPAEVGQHLAQVGVEARGRGAVDDAVVPAQAQRQHQARHEGLAVHTGSIAALAHAQDGHLGRVDDGREVAPADAAQAADAEAAAAHVGRAQLAVARLLGQFAHLLADLQTPFLSASLITGTTRPLGVSAAKPMWKYCLSAPAGRRPGWR